MTITTKAELIQQLDEWKAAGFNGATSDDTTHAFWCGYPIEKWGTYDGGKQIIRPHTSGVEPWVYRVEAERYTSPLPPALRIADDCSGKFEYRAVRLAPELLIELGVPL